MKIFLTHYFIYFFFIILYILENTLSNAVDNLSINKDDGNGNIDPADSLNNLNDANNLNNVNISNKKRKQKQNLEENLKEDANDYFHDYIKEEKNFEFDIDEHEEEKGIEPKFQENKLNAEDNQIHPNIEDFHYYSDNIGDIDANIDNERYFSSIWDDNMKNFEPSTLLTFEISGNSEEFLFEEVNKVDTYFRGVFYSNNESDDNIIEFFISDPDGKVLYRKEASEGIFFFYVKKVGIYTLTLKNNKWLGKKLTTVALGLGENPSLKSDDVKSFTNYIMQIVSETKKLKNEIKYLSAKHMIYIEKMKKITNKAFIYCFIKLFVLIFLSLFTIYYIKNLVSNKRVL